jgi:L-fuconolactonase
MTEQMGRLKRDFLPADLKPLLDSLHFDGCIAVQARQNLQETQWLLDLAQENDFIAGVVGWVDLRSPELPAQLSRFAAHPKLAGVRHVLHDEPDDLFMLDPAFRRGIAQLHTYNLTYDLLLFPRHLAPAARLAGEFPAQPFVLDHIGKPHIRDGVMSPWREDLRALAALPNVSCKLSGMVTEASWSDWKPSDLVPYLEVVFDCFGPDRLMIGSDWPVCTLAASYRETMQVVLDYLAQLPAEAQERILGGNCAKFYGIDSMSPDQRQEQA